ncbi:MAG: rod shape-determining protein RodA [Patescibacteria group bacterium]
MWTGFAKKYIKNFSISEWLLWIITFSLVVAGQLIFYSLSLGDNDINLWLKQAMIILIACFLYWWFGKSDYRFFKGVAWYGLIIATILLIAVLLFGRIEYGARRWLDVGIVGFQPTELVKAALIIFLAKYFSEKGDDLRLKDMIFTLALVVILMFFIARQPDLGSSLVLLAIWFGMIVCSSISRKYIIGLLVAALFLLPVFWISLHDYQRNRVMSFIDPTLDPYGAGYNILQSQIAVGSGGWWGLGIGRGWQSQLHFLPVAYSDFAFAVWAEEFGFVGGLLLLILFALLVWQIWRIAYLAADQFGFFLVVGVATMIIFQVFVNTGMNLGIMPVTGIPLPFISSGGTSIWAVMFLLGLVVSVSRRSEYKNIR